MKYKTILIIIIFSVFLSGSYHENFLNEQIKTAENYNLTKSLSEETTKALENLGLSKINPEKLLSLSVKDFISLIAENLVLKIKDPFKAVLAITAASIICALMNSFFDNSGTGVGGGIVVDTKIYRIGDRYDDRKRSS